MAREQCYGEKNNQKLEKFLYVSHALPFPDFQYLTKESVIVLKSLYIIF